ncbi:MAG: SAM-dependent methyltransferase, partial [Candidatus Marinimicrobia bacterium]|nr:SAM-dependent methyltransferase [Candidatus Neomarinimicrobiota bacterium]
MNTNQLKRFAQAARIRLLEDVKNRFLYWGIDQDGNFNYSVETTTGGYVFRSGVYNDESVPKKWNNLLNAVKHHTPNDTIEEASYIWFNRFMAIMILEKNGYDDPALAYAGNGIDPVLLQNAKRGDTPQMDEQAKRQLQEYITNSQDDEALSLLLIHYCKNHKLLNRLFGQIDDYTELLLPNNLLAKDGIIELINSDEFITDDDYKEVELIGWLYQFYISDKKDD